MPFTDLHKYIKERKWDHAMHKLSQDMKLAAVPFYYNGEESGSTLPLHMVLQYGGSEGRVEALILLLIQAYPKAVTILGYDRIIERNELPLEIAKRRKSSKRVITAIQETQEKYKGKTGKECLEKRDSDFMDLSNVMGVVNRSSIVQKETNVKFKF